MISANFTIWSWVRTEDSDTNIFLFIGANQAGTRFWPKWMAN